MTRPAARFRYNAAITVAAAVAFIGAVPFAAARWYFLPVLLVPLLVAVWGWRAGTDVDRQGLRLRALLGHRDVPWSQVTGLAPDERGRVHAALTNGAVVRLPAVTAADLPRLVAAGGQTPAGGDAAPPDTEGRAGGGEADASSAQ